jgi:hypothetical protein
LTVPPGMVTFPKGEKNSGRCEVSKVGRNDPCPCGSGRKAKKCCGDGWVSCQSCEATVPAAKSVKLRGITLRNLAPVVCLMCAAMPDEAHRDACAALEGGAAAA